MMLLYIYVILKNKFAKIDGKTEHMMIKKQNFLWFLIFETIKKIKF